MEGAAVVAVAETDLAARPARSAAAADLHRCDRRTETEALEARTQFDRRREIEVFEARTKIGLRT